MLIKCLLVMGRTGGVRHERPDLRPATFREQW